MTHSRWNGFAYKKENSDDWNSGRKKFKEQSIIDITDGILLLVQREDKFTIIFFPRYL